MRVNSERVTVHCGHHVLAFSRRGMIEPEDDGYYYNQTRFISRFGLTSKSKDLNSVACVPVEPHATVSYLLLPSPAGRKAAPPGDPEPSGGEIVQKAIEIRINTFVGGGYHQDVDVTNHALAVAKSGSISISWPISQTSRRSLRAAENKPRGSIAVFPPPRPVGEN